MDSFYFFLQEIRERPGLYLGGKSLEALGHFWAGYGYCSFIERWEKATGRDYFENYEEARCSDVGREPFEQHFMYGFDEFVHEYYNCVMTTLNGKSLISKNSDSDGEAFDKFFELFDEYLKLTDMQKEKIKTNAQKRFRESFEPEIETLDRGTTVDL